MSVVQNRAWSFTLNNYTPEDLVIIKGVPTKYTVYGFEVAPDTGTPHIQGFVLFDTPKRLSWMKNNVAPRAHFEMTHPKSGNVWYDRSIAYCKKGNFVYAGWANVPDEECVNIAKRSMGEGGWLGYQSGTKPVGRKQTCQERWNTLINRFNDGEGPASLVEDYPHEMLMYNKHLNMMRDLLNPVQDMQTKRNMIWIYGPSNTGKTTKAKMLAREDWFEKNPSNKWWDGYNRQKTVIIEDMGPDFAKNKDLMWPSTLKILADRFVVTVEVKGGTLRIRPETIIVTSQYEMWELFDHDTVIALQNRTKLVLKMTQLKEGNEPGLVTEIEGEDDMEIQ